MSQERSPQRTESRWSAARRCARTAALAGASVGGVLLGGTISALHVTHNPGLGPAGALSALVFFMPIFALATASGSAVLAVVLSWVAPRRAGWLGLAAALLVFFEAIAFYGVTYDQTILFEPDSIGQMTLYLALGAGLVAVAVFLVGRALAGMVASLQRARRLARAVALAVGLLVVAHIALALTNPAVPAAESSQVSETEVEILETGLRVVLIGLDGTDPRVVDRLIEDGALPEWSARRARGAHGELATLGGANSAVIWASIYTGYDRDEHGVLDFYRVKLPGTGRGLFPVHRTWFKEIANALEPLGLVSRQVVARPQLGRLPIWEISDHFGLETGVVDGYYYSYPAIKPLTPGGYFLTYGLDYFLATAKGEERLGLPRYLQPIDLFEGEPLPRGGDLEWQTDAALRLLAARPQPRFMNFYTHEPDAVQHEAWSGWEPGRFFPWQRNGDRGAVREKHRSFDQLIRNLDEATAENTVFLLVSDHGHSATPVHKLASQHRHGPPGVILAWGGPVRAGLRLDDAHVFDIAPTVLHLLGMPVPADAPGRVLLELFEPAFVEDFPVRTVPSYEGMWTPRMGDGERDGELNREEIEKLRSLGYL